MAGLAVRDDDPWEAVVSSRLCPIFPTLQEFKVGFRAGFEIGRPNGCQYSRSIRSTRNQRRRDSQETFHVIMVHPRVIRKRPVIDVCKGESRDTGIRLGREPDGALPGSPCTQEHLPYDVVDCASKGKRKSWSVCQHCFGLEISQGRRGLHTVIEDCFQKSWSRKE